MILTIRTFFKAKTNISYSFVSNCRDETGGGRGVQLQTFGEKTPQIHLIIIRKLPNSLTPFLSNPYNFPPGAFYSTPPPPRIRHKSVNIEHQLKSKLA